MQEKQQEKIPKEVLIQSILIGILFGGDQIFGFFEQNFFNTYLEHVLWLEPFEFLFLKIEPISLMVSLSAAVGLVANLTWGIISDNTRSRFGRRKPYLLFGGIIAGVSMIAFAFTQDYLSALVIDVLIIGIASNAYYVTERSLIPDSVDIEHRGRANGIVNIIGYIGLLIAVAGFLIANELFSVPNPVEDGTIITPEGHFFVLLIGGGAFILCGIIGFLTIKEVSPFELPPRRSFLSELKQIFNYSEFRKNNEFFKLTLAYTIFRCGIGVIMPFLFVYIFSLGLSTLELVGSIGIGFPVLFIVIFILGRLADRYGRKKFVPASIVITSIGLVGVLFVKQGTEVNLLIFGLTLPFILVALLGLVTPLNAWAQDLMPEEERGKFYGLLNIIFTISQIIGAFTAGFVTTNETLGTAWIFPLGAVFFLISIPFFMMVKETLLQVEE